MSFLTDGIGHGQDRWPHRNEADAGRGDPVLDRIPEQPVPR
jgi:hypothetical protein